MINQTSHETSWVIDRCFHSYTLHDGILYVLYGNFGYLKMINDGEGKVIGIGDICLETDSAFKLNLKDVKHVSVIRLNLIPAGKLEDDGYCNSFVKRQWKLTKGSLIVAKGGYF